MQLTTTYAHAYARGGEDGWGGWLTLKDEPAGCEDEDVELFLHKVRCA